MPTSARGSSLIRQTHAGRAAPHGAAARGFTMIEVMVVVAIVAIAMGVVSLALRDPALSRLERDATRLATLLEMARAEARAAGLPVVWAPSADSRGDAPQFLFVGLPKGSSLPTRWLDAQVQATVLTGTSLRLGPEAILPPQRVSLGLQGQRVEVASDGLNSFAVVETAATP